MSPDTGANRARAPVLAAALACGLFLAAPARAQPPNLNTLDGEAGETELEFTGYAAAARSGDTPGFQFNSEINHAFSDRFGAQLQLTGFDAGAGPRMDEASVQLLARVVQLTGGSLGVSVEAGVDRQGAGSLGALVYGVVPALGWRTAFNLGVETATAGDEAAMVYAWEAARPLSRRLDLALEGGGAATVRGDAADEHYAGPSLEWSLARTGDGPRLRVGYLFGLTRASPDLAHVGISASF